MEVGRTGLSAEVVLKHRWQGHRGRGSRGAGGGAEPATALLREAGGLGWVELGDRLCSATAEDGSGKGVVE